MLSVVWQAQHSHFFVSPTRCQGCLQLPQGLCCTLLLVTLSGTGHIDRIIGESKATGLTIDHRGPRTSCQRGSVDITVRGVATTSVAIPTNRRAVNGRGDSHTIAIRLYFDWIRLIEQLGTVETIFVGRDKALCQEGEECVGSCWIGRWTRLSECCIEQHTGGRDLTHVGTIGTGTRHVRVLYRWLIDTGTVKVQFGDAAVPVHEHHRVASRNEGLGSSLMSSSLKLVERQGRNHVALVSQVSGHPGSAAESAIEGDRQQALIATIR